jgi:hypothetical protein
VGSTASVEEDIFSSVGGLELGHDLSGPDAAGSAAAVAAAEQLLAGASSAAAGSLSMPSVTSLADLAPVDTPSRTLFVQNIAVDVPDDELRRLFSSHGDLRTLYTACKARGLVIVGYFDLRSAIAAATQLSGYPLAGRQLEVAFSAPKKGETNQVNQVGGWGQLQRLGVGLECIQNAAFCSWCQEWILHAPKKAAASVGGHSACFQVASNYACALGRL